MTTKKKAPRSRYALPLLQTLGFSDATAEVRLDEDRLRVFTRAINDRKADWVERGPETHQFRVAADTFIKIVQAQPTQPRSLFETIFGERG